MEIEEAVGALTAELKPVGETGLCPLARSAGRILGEDVTSGMDVPSFPKSAMDGYAVRSSDIAGASPESPVKLEVIACLMAGDSIPSEVSGRPSYEGHAVCIMTGAAVPSGFDTVVKQEDTDLGESTVSVYKSQQPFVNYCKAGEDIKCGTRVLAQGTYIGRTEAGILASLGLPQVSVVRRLKVSVISTGSEIVDVGLELQEAQIYNSIAYTIQASLGKPAFDVTCTTVPDDEDAILQALRDAVFANDIIITTGGVSVGKKDLLPQVLDKLGAKRVFSGVNVKPGSPTIGAVIGGKPILCLSGNPYAAVANFDLYIGNIICALTGCSAFVPVRSKAVLQSDYTKPSNIRRLVRAMNKDGLVAVLSKNQQSSILSSYIGANCYIDFPEGSSCKAGDEVDIMVIPEALL